MFKKGMKKPDGAGRKKGVPNRNSDLLAICEEYGLNLFEEFVKIIIDETNDSYLRMTALKEAAQYVYPKKKAVEHSSSEDFGIKITIEDYKSSKSKDD